MERKHLTLSCGDKSITLLGAIGEQAETGLLFSSLDGWYSTPQTKVDSTEYETANGAPQVTDDEVHYAARTVTIGVSIKGSNRDAVRSSIESILGFAQKVITVTVSDAKSETYATGYVAYTSDTHMDSSGATGSLVIVCNDPQRYSTKQSVGTIVPTSLDGGGLVFNATTHSLMWPLSFGAGAIRTGNSCTIYNNGTIPADITITASGNMPDGFALTNLATGEQLVYGGMVTYQPVTLDVFDGTAFIAGVDVSRSIGSWDFSGVPAKGSCSFSLQASGTGTVQVSCRDTYV